MNTQIKGANIRGVLVDANPSVLEEPLLHRVPRLAHDSIDGPIAIKLTANAEIFLADMIASVNDENCHAESWSGAPDGKELL